jgi:cullin 1
VCGFEYTSKMQRMFSDITVNRDLNDKFRAWQTRHAVLATEFSVLVLATGSWPLEPLHTDVLLPPDLDACVTTFATFYKELLSGRKLQWLFHLSRAEVTYTVRPRQRFMLTQATAFHVAVLAQFNADTERSAVQLQQATSLSAPVLAAVLGSLVKTKVLLPPVSGAAGSYTLNPDFKRYLSHRTLSRPVCVCVLMPPQQEGPGACGAAADGGGGPQRGAAAAGGRAG